MKRFILLIASALFIGCRSGDKTKTEVTGKDSGTSYPAPSNDTVKQEQPAITKTDLESLGPLQIGQPSMELIGKFGSPEKQSTLRTWDSDGMLHQDWEYKATGVVINLSATPTAPDRSKMIFSITAKSPCALKTSRNIGIGSSYEEVKNTYKGFIDESLSDDALITVGSVYGGILFRFKDNKVETIYIGPAAE